MPTVRGNDEACGGLAQGVRTRLRRPGENELAGAQVNTASFCPTPDASRGPTSVTKLVLPAAIALSLAVVPCARAEKPPDTETEAGHLLGASYCNLFGYKSESQV